MIALHTVIPYRREISARQHRGDRPERQQEPYNFAASST